MNVRVAKIKLAPVEGNEAETVMDYLLKELVKTFVSILISQILL